MTTISAREPATASPFFNSGRDASVLAGRILIAAIFIASGLSKVPGFAPGFAGTAAYIASRGVPLPELCTMISICLEVSAGLMVLLGYRTRMAALALAVFVLVITPVFHGPGAAAAEPFKTLQLHAMFKNITTLGGLLVLAAFGAGRYSLDARAQRI